MKSQLATLEQSKKNFVESLLQSKHQHDEAEAWKNYESYVKLLQHQIQQLRKKEKGKGIEKQYIAIQRQYQRFVDLCSLR